MRVLSLAKKPGTAYARRVNYISGGALSDDHPARKAGLTHDGISMLPLDELEDDEVSMDPTGRQVYRDEDMHNWLNVQHDQGFRIGHPNTERRPTWPTRREISLSDYRRFGGPEPAEFSEGVTDVLRRYQIPEDDWERWIEVLMPRQEIETAEELEEFFERPTSRLMYGPTRLRTPESTPERTPEMSASPSLASVAAGEEDSLDEVYDMLEYYTNRMENAVTTGDRMELDHAYMQADSMLEEDLAHIAQPHHRNYLRTYYEHSMSQLPNRGMVRGREEEEEEDYSPDRTRQRYR